MDLSSALSSAGSVKTYIRKKKDLISLLLYAPSPLPLFRNLSYNNLTRLDEGSLAVLGELHSLRLGHNAISHIDEGAFRGLKALRVL